MFRDRTDAGQELGKLLLPYKNRRPVVLALPRGGVPVAFEIAKLLDAPLDLLLVRKIGAPHQPELALGAVVDGPKPEIFINQEIVQILGVPDSYIAEESQRQIREIERRRELYLAGRPRADLHGRVVIVVDDGIATGATVRVALRALKRAGAGYVVLAAPVAPADTAEMLRRECDDTVFVSTRDDFGAVGLYYDDFSQVTDADVAALLHEAPTPA